MWWLSWHVLAGYARQHRLRTLVQVLAIAVGVALGYAVHLINASALNEFSSAVRAVTGQADASIAGAREGFDEQLFERVVASPAVELASPVLELDVPVLGIGSGRPPLLPIVGLDVFRAAGPVADADAGARLRTGPAASRSSTTACSSRRPRSNGSGCAWEDACACWPGRVKWTFRSWARCPARAPGS